jgi:SAM-dependent methyltransferase
MRGVYQRLLERWMPSAAGGRSLKTDLFEEALGAHHLLPALGAGAIGIDCSLAIVRAARDRLGPAGGGRHLVVGDLRHVPLRSGSVGRILAGSSLDHFASKTDIATGLAELARVLAPGGTLMVTFDNPHNPLIRLRNRLPFRWLHRLGLTPYYVGATYDRAEARSQLEGLGLSVTAEGAVAHAPRAPAIWLAGLAERRGWRWLSAALARGLPGFEVLERWPTRYWTGYYLAVVARKPPER